VYFDFDIRDAEGNGPTTNGQLFGGFQFWRLQGAAVSNVDGYSNTGTVTGTASQAHARVPICFNMRPDGILISIEDQGGNASNAHCVDVPEML